MSSAVADSGTVQANTSLAMAPKPRLFFLSTMAKKLFGGAAEDDDHTPLAKELGLDVAGFSRCLLRPETHSTIVSDISTASQHGVRGVPVIFLNGRPVKGAQPIDTYRQIISEELAKSPK